MSNFSIGTFAVLYAVFLYAVIDKMSWSYYLLVIILLVGLFLAYRSGIKDGEEGRY